MLCEKSAGKKWHNYHWARGGSCSSLILNILFHKTMSMHPSPWLLNRLTTRLVPKLHPSCSQFVGMRAWFQADCTRIMINRRRCKIQNFPGGMHSYSPSWWCTLRALYLNWTKLLLLDQPPMSLLCNKLGLTSIQSISHLSQKVVLCNQQVIHLKSNNISSHQILELASFVALA